MNERDEILSQLRDLELPTVSNTLAPGWWLLLLFVVLFAALAYYLYRRWQSRLWQREAQAELKLIREQLGSEPSIALLSHCSELVRKVVLAVDDREQVAALHGESWIEKLDDICARPEFSQGIGRLLVDHPYQKQPVITSHDLSALFDSVDVLINSAARYKPTYAGGKSTDDVIRSAS